MFSTQHHISHVHDKKFYRIFDLPTDTECVSADIQQRCLLVNDVFVYLNSLSGKDKEIEQIRNASRLSEHESTSVDDTPRQTKISRKPKTKLKTDIEICTVESFGVDMTKAPIVGMLQRYLEDSMRYKFKRHVPIGPQSKSFAQLSFESAWRQLTCKFVAESYLDLLFSRRSNPVQFDCEKVERSNDLDDIWRKSMCRMVSVVSLFCYCCWNL